uniref:Uncharacterized protein n=1 Tax=Sinocyclocheilus rhinocerous TaxID=307959 RepID=A0A673FIN7_9TELE
FRDSSRHIASLHELASEAASPSSLIIVDSLDHYLHGSRVGPLQDDLSPVAHVAALLHDTAAFLTQILQNLGLKVLFFTQTPFRALPVSLRASIPGLKLESLKVIIMVCLMSVMIIKNM